MHRLITLLLATCALLAQVREGQAPRDGFDLHWRIRGSGSPTVVLLSGGPGFDVDYMEPLTDELSKHVTCVLLEQRGTGRSRLSKITKENCNLHLVTEDLEAYRKVSGQAKLTLVGHSWGGGLAMLYAAAYPENVDRMALVSSMGMDTSFFRYFGDNIRSRLWPEDREASKKAKPGLDGVLAILPGYFFDRAKALEFRRNTPQDSYHPDVNAAITAGYDHYDLKTGLHDFARPVLQIQGRQDPIGDGTVYETAKVLGNSRIQFLDRCGHFPWLEAPREFFAAIERFLEEP